MTIHTLNIAFNALSFGGGMKSIAKCLMKRGVKGFRPPPGGAHAAVITTSFIPFQNIFSRSYSPP